MSLGHPSYPRPKGTRNHSMAEKRGYVEIGETGPRKTRVAWSKLDRLNPNPDRACQATLILTPLPPVLIPTPIMPSCYRLLTSPSGSFLIFTSVSRWVCSGSTFVNLDRINPLLRFSRSR